MGEFVVRLGDAPDLSRTRSFQRGSGRRTHNPSRSPGFESTLAAARRNPRIVTRSIPDPANASRGPRETGAPLFPRPIVVVSECLEFEPCRYNGATIRFDLIRALEPFVEYRRVCPEVGIGLGIPRDPIRIVAREGGRRLVQPATGRDLTAAMERFAAEFVSSVGEVDGFILKSRSPSCGLAGVKVLAGPESGRVVERGAGFFAAAVAARFGDLAIADEAQLRDERIREHLLTQLFAFARLRQVAAGGTMADLVRFHASHKFLLLASDERRYRELGRIVGGDAGSRGGITARRATAQRIGGEPTAAMKHGQAEDFLAIAAGYRTLFHRALQDPPRNGPLVNAFEHIFGFLSQGLSAAERIRYRTRLEGFRTGELPESEVTSLLRSWARRLGSDYILGQAILTPFPPALARPPLPPTRSGHGPASKPSPGQIRVPRVTRDEPRAGHRRPTSGRSATTPAVG